MVVEEGPFALHLRESATMIVLGPLLVIVGIKKRLPSSIRRVSPGAGTLPWQGRRGLSGLHATLRFMTINPECHVSAQSEMFNHLVEGNGGLAVGGKGVP